MNWGPPPTSWEQVSKSDFDDVMSYMRYKRTGWGDAIVYYCIFQRKELGCVWEETNPHTYYLNPKGVHDA